MPDKPLETTWLGTRVLPAARRARRVGRRIGRRARSTILPKVGSLGAVGLNLPTTDLTTPSAQPERIRRCGVVVLGVPDDPQMPGQWREVLIHAERHSIPTVLRVTSAEQLLHPLAAVVTHLVTTDPQVLRPLQDFAGTERTALLDPVAGKREQLAALSTLTCVHTPLESS